MSVIFNSDFIKAVKRSEDKYNFFIQINEMNNLFYQSVQLENVIFTEDDSDPKYLKLDVTAKSVQSLPQYLAKKSGYLSYQDCLQIFYHIGNQILFLEQNGFSMLQINPEDILVIDDVEFLIASTLNAFQLDSKDDKKIRVDSVLRETPFSTKEIDGLSDLPATIPKTNWMMSLGMMLSFFLTNQKQILTTKTYESVKENIDSILDTKLYFALLRCCANNPEERKYLLI